MIHADLWHLLWDATTCDWFESKQDFDTFWKGPQILCGEPFYDQQNWRFRQNSNPKKRQKIDNFLKVELNKNG